MRFRKKVFIAGKVKILGIFPIFKFPKETKILDIRSLLNSVYKHLNSSLTFNCTLVCGLKGIINSVGNTML